jgi:hypothetical protein
MVRMLEQKKLKTIPTRRSESPAAEPIRRLMRRMSEILTSAPSIALDATPNTLVVAIKESAAPSAAPEETPRVNGLASGFLKRV